MPALVAGIHVFLCCPNQKDVDGRDKPGHDVERAVTADLRLARYLDLSKGLLMGLQTGYVRMERKRAVGDRFKVSKAVGR